MQHTHPRTYLIGQHDASGRDVGGVLDLDEQHVGQGVQGAGDLHAVQVVHYGGEKRQRIDKYLITSTTCKQPSFLPFHFDRIRVPWVMVVREEEEEKAVCLWGAGIRKAWRRRGRPASRQARMGSVATIFLCRSRGGTGGRSCIRMRWGRLGRR